MLSLYEKTRSPGGAENDFHKRQGISQYRAVESVQDKAPVSPVSADNTVTPIRQLIAEIAGKYGIPEPWFAKLVRQESGLDPSAESPKGAMGLGQLMPATARELGLRVGSPRDRGEGSVWHPASNLDASARYLRQLYDLYANKGIDVNEAWSFAAGAYNAGMGNIQKALDKLESGRPPAWEDVAAVLPQVTGTASRETLRYVDNLRA
ncbi:MAG: transglycosylase SLT domain-containing protein [Nitrospinae bacterium]|nr:transglycosylase SLT domain-containing protein [Nitrospinota bacterium]